MKNTYTHYFKWNKRKNSLKTYLFKTDLNMLIISFISLFIIPYII